jgi:hypothetical protein
MRPAEGTTSTTKGEVLSARSEPTGSQASQQQKTTVCHATNLPASIHGNVLLTGNVRESEDRRNRPLASECLAFASRRSSATGTFPCKAGGLLRHSTKATAHPQLAEEQTDHQRYRELCRRGLPFLPQCEDHSLPTCCPRPRAAHPKLRWPAHERRTPSISSPSMSAFHEAMRPLLRQHPQWHHDFVEPSLGTLLVRLFAGPLPPQDRLRAPRRRARLRGFQGLLTMTTFFGNTRRRISETIVHQRFALARAWPPGCRNVCHCSGVIATSAMGHISPLNDCVHLPGRPQGT